MISITAKNFIDGGWQEPVDRFESLDPADCREVVGSAPRSTEADVDAAVGAARKSIQKWRDMGPVRRAETIDSFAQVMKRYGKEVAKYLTRETGKPTAEAVAEVQDALAIAQHCAGLGRSVSGLSTGSPQSTCDATVTRRPRGVVACISPGFSPVALPLRQILPSLVAGNTVVWKPSEDTPVCAQWLSRLFLEGGILEGAVNIVHGAGETIGAMLAGHRDVNAVLFAGSRRTAHELHKRFGGDLNRSLCLEGGGIGAGVVLADADLEAAATAAALSAFRTSGQRLNTIDRIFVEASVEAAFVDLFVAKAQALKIGPGAETDVTLGPLVSVDAKRRWSELRNCVLEGDGEVVYDGGDLIEGPYEHGWFASPFIWRCSATDVAAQRDEARCPHVGIVPVGGLKQAVEAFNAAQHGTSLALFTQDLRKIRWVRENADFEQGYVNTAVAASEAQLLAAGQASYGTGQAGLPSVQSAIAHDASFAVG